MTVVILYAGSSELIDHAKDLYPLRTSVMPYPQSLGSHHMPLKFHVCFIYITEILLKYTCQHDHYFSYVLIYQNFIFSSLITISLACSAEHTFKNYSLNNLSPKSPLHIAFDFYSFWEGGPTPGWPHPFHVKTLVCLLEDNICIGKWRSTNHPWLGMIITWEDTYSAQLLTGQRCTEKPGGQDNAKCPGIFIPANAPCSRLLHFAVPEFSSIQHLQHLAICSSLYKETLRCLSVRSI